MKTIVTLFVILFWIQSLHGQEWKWEGEEPLNVVWITTEDMKPTLPMYGDEAVETPNLERLAAQGMTYTNAFSVSGMCSPSRSCLATGVYPIHMGSDHMRTQDGRWTGKSKVEGYEAVPPPEVRMVSEILRANGYYATNNVKEDYQFNKPPTAWDESSDTAHWKNRPEGKPFFAVFNYMETHESRLWRRADLPVEGVDVSKIRVPAYLPDTAVVRKDLTTYYNNIHAMDQWVGGLLDELEAEGLLDNTVIFFYSDHGGSLPREKRMLYDSGLRAPLIIRLPGADWRHVNITHDRLVSFVDFPPTLLSIVGIEPPEWMQGVAFLGDYRGPEREYVYAARSRMDEYYDKQRAVRDERYKYIHTMLPGQPSYVDGFYRKQIATMREMLKMRSRGELDEEELVWFDPERPVEELYDTWVDPDEVHNLAGDPKYAEKLDELRRENLKFLDRVADLNAMPEARLLQLLWPNGTQPVTADPVVTQEGRIVTISCATLGASIGYRVWQGSDKPESWQVYTGPFELPRGMNLEVVAHRIGYKPSEVRSMK